MNLATKKWVFIKISSVILLPLMFWFIINFINIYDNNYLDVVKGSLEGPLSFLSNTMDGAIYTDSLRKLNDVKFGYNWPYDFFSLIELIKVDAKLDFEMPGDQ